MTKVQKNNTKNNEKELSQDMPWKERTRYIIGFLMLFIGSFLTIAVISYFDSWQQDESAIKSSQTLMNYMLNNDEPVANWSGRIGAAMAFLLVKKSMGIVAILFTAWIAAIGINLIYNKRKLPTNKWLRWMALGFLFLCPLLALIFSESQFSYGGVLGNALINWTRGAAGYIGVILMLLLVLLVFVIMVFKWDLKPWLNAMSFKMPKSKSDLIEHLNPIPNPVNVDSCTYNEMETDDEEQNSTVNTNPFSGNAYDSDESDTERDISNIDEQYEEQDLQLVEVNPTNAFHETNDDHISFNIQEKDGITIELPENETEDEEVTKKFHTAKRVSEQQQHLKGNTETKVYIGTTDKEPEPEPEKDFDGLDFKVITTKSDDAMSAVTNVSIEDKEEYAPELDLPNFKFPTLDLLDDKNMGEIALDHEELQKNKDQIINTLRSFGIEIQKIEATVGPTVTLYEIVPAEGIRISKIRNLEDDIALNLAALGIRMIAPIPGKGTIGIEVPNVNKQIVPMRSLLSSEKFINSKMMLPIALGKKIDNENYIVDLASMPHLLMAGATGQGKSVGINAILVSLLYKKHPSQLKFVLVDPKKVELSVYRLIENHYLAKLPEEEAIITDTKKVINTLNSLCIEMDNRYELLKDAGARNIKEYNQKFIKRKLNPNNGHKYLPFIVLVIDEFADLIMTAGKEVEMPVARLAQLARAVGIHLIVATQRPSVNVITGIIKANFPARIAFRVTAKVDSRTILDTGGADQLIGRGDMLVSHGSELLRLQCAFVDTPEVERIVDFIGQQRGYPSAFELPEYEGADEETMSKESVDLSKRDKIFEDSARLVVNSQSGSTSMLQRKFNIGFNRAGRIMDQLEAAGIVGPQVGSKPRDVMVSTEYELENILEELNAK